MKNFFTLMTLLAICSTSLQAQWVSKASGFSTPQRGINELIAVNSNVAWAADYDAVNPISAPITEFTITTDGGKHWMAGSISEFPDYYLLGIAPLSATLCYASISNLDNGNAKVVKTSDGGATWTAQLNYDFLPGNFNFFSDIYFFNANEGLAYGDQSDGYFTIFTTSDGGNNWTRVPQANMPASIAPDEASYTLSAEGIGNTFWTVSTAGRIWKTTDKGLHWNAYQSSETSIDFSNLKMRDAQHGLWGVHDELYRTNDGGITWNEITPTGNWFTDDLAYVPGTAATFVSTGGNDFTGYGVLHGTGSSYSLDDGDTWITLDTGVEHLSLAMVNSFTGFTGGINTNSSIGGIYVYNGPALGYACENNKTKICYHGQSLCVAHGAIKSLLNHGGTLGDCDGEKVSQTQEGNAMTVSPNPMSELSVINFDLAAEENVLLQIFDVSGRLIATLADEAMSAGDHNLQWNAADVNSGIYFLKMEAGEYSATEKISIIK
ncbi:MAG TPA: T9SS type A sorting domain-containing protein [Chitinophagales bacterium]|nr:T9SS type A sorting domain-containing protein [Chitinophagales bacterium]